MAGMPTLERDIERDLKIGEALALIDGGLGDMRHRELVSTGEVEDLLLDIRSILSPLVEVSPLAVTS